MTTPNRKPEPESRTTTSTPFDLERYVPSPEALREMGDDEADAALLKQVLDRPEVEEAREALRADAAGEHHPLVDALKRPEEREDEPPTPAPPPPPVRRRKWWVPFAIGLAVSLCVVLPAMFVFVFFVRPEGTDAGTARSSAVPPPVVSVVVVMPTASVEPSVTGDPPIPIEPSAATPGMKPLPVPNPKVTGELRPQVPPTASARDPFLHKKPQ